MENQPKSLLLKHDLRHTETREKIILGFLSRPAALSHGEIENFLGTGFDRVTIYRTLKTFLDKGIIHKIPDDQGGLKYALCAETCSEKNHNHDHVHFKCLVCNDTTCLEQVLIPNILLPDGYKRNEINMLVQGTCPKCK
jgi:Fur family ferric uptake transcriptional regulator